MVEHRRKQLDEWRSWRAQTEADLREQRQEMGLPPDPEDEAANGVPSTDAEGKVVEEIVEEIIEEKEEVV